MLDLSLCKTKREAQIYFAGIRQGIREMENFEIRKNVNTGKPLTLDEILRDFVTLEGSAMEELFND